MSVPGSGKVISVTNSGRVISITNSIKAMSVTNSSRAISVARFEARLFGPGLPAPGEPVQVEMRSRALVLHLSNGRESEVDYSRLRVAGSGWRGDALLLEWQDDAGPCALSVQRREALVALREQAPEALRARLGPRARRPARVPAKLWVASLGMLALIAAFVTLAVTQADRLVDAAVRRVPPAWEEKLGEMSVASIAGTGGLRTQGEAPRVVQELGDRLAATTESPYTFHWYLVEDPQVNAMAAPGGYVVVFTGLLRETQSEEELAGVLAHEMQHVLLRHSVRGMVRALGWRTIVSLALGWGGELGGAAAGVVEQLGTLRFSRAQELEADAAVRALQRAGIDPLGMATFFDRLAARGGEPPAFLSTHPASQERARRIRELAAGSPPFPPLASDWRNIQAELQP